MTSGVHEHAWHLHYMDVHMRATALMAERLQDVDRLSAGGMRRHGLPLRSMLITKDMNSGPVWPLAMLCQLSKSHNCHEAA